MWSIGEERNGQDNATPACRPRVEVHVAKENAIHVDSRLATVGPNPGHDARVAPREAEAHHRPGGRRLAEGLSRSLEVRPLRPGPCIGAGRFLQHADAERRTRVPGSLVTGEVRGAGAERIRSGSWRK